MAMAMLAPISGSKVKAWSTGRSSVTAASTWLPILPRSVRRMGFHIQKGRCGDNGNAAGGHSIPRTLPHAAPDAQSHHAATLATSLPRPTGGARSFNHALDHTDAAVRPRRLATPDPCTQSDDLTTQPSGNAGARIACAVVSLHDAAGMHH